MTSHIYFLENISSNGPPVPDRILLPTTTAPAKIPIGFLAISNDNFFGSIKAMKGSTPKTK